MNYDLCSGTCLKKSGIYSVAMFQNGRRSFDFLPFFVLASGIRTRRIWAERKRAGGTFLAQSGKTGTTAKQWWFC